MRAWKLIQTMNRCFRKPLVSALRGGQRKRGHKAYTHRHPCFEDVRTIGKQKSADHLSNLEKNCKTAEISRYI